MPPVKPYGKAAVHGEFAIVNLSKKEENQVLKTGPLTSDGMPTYYVSGGQIVAVLAKGATPRDLARAIRDIKIRNGIPVPEEKFLDIRKM